MPETMFDLTTFGETMLRISVPPGIALQTAASAGLCAAGAESNVAAALAQLGWRAGWASQLPDNPPGRLIAGELRRAGVDLSMLRWSDSGRVGTFFVELELPPVPVRVTYDRAGSCASQLSIDAIDWDRLLSTRLLHLTGITPGLSASCRALAEAAVERARAAGVPLSIDVNYRSRLWSAAEARQVLTPLLKEVELLFIARADAEAVFDLTGTPEQQLRALAGLSGARRIILSIGSEGVLAWDEGTMRLQPAMPTNIVDRLGAGDALAAGVIHGWLSEDFIGGLRAGTALAALALRRQGDIVTCTAADLAELVSGGTDRPQR